MLLPLLGRTAAAVTSPAAAAATGALQQLLPLLPLQQAACDSLQQHQQQQQQQQQHQWHPQQQQLQQQHVRWFSSSRALGDLRDFLDSVDPANASSGRAWLAKELRNKSFDDLHKLWYVCLKERNMLLTQITWEQSKQRRTQQQSRLLEDYISRVTAVKKTMNRIKQVLSERAHNEADAVKAINMKRVIHYM